MYQELCFYTKNLYSKEDIRDGIFLALEYKFNGINLPICLLPEYKQYIPAGIVISVPIDYPYGVSGSKIREHQIIHAANQGATAVDLVINNYLILDKSYKKLVNEIKANQSICKDKQITLRIILDYKLFDSAKIMAIGKLLKALGIEYVLPSPGETKDDLIENIIFSKQLEKIGLSAICNGSIWLPKHYEIVTNSSVFGVRFHSVFAIKNLICNQ